MSQMKNVLTEFDLCISFYPIISFAIILGLSINFIFSIDFYYTNLGSIHIINGFESINRALAHSVLLFIYLLAQLYLSIKYISIVISLKHYIKEASKNNIAITTDMKNYIRKKMFNSFPLRIIAISVSILIIFSKTIFTTCDDLCNVHLINYVHYIYATVFLVTLILIEYPTFNLLAIYSKHLYDQSTEGEYTKPLDKIKYFILDTIHAISSKGNYAHILFMLLFLLFGLMSWSCLNYIYQRFPQLHIF